ncbi:DegV family protein [Rarobacter incanus]|uniref:DegV family protein with EDD domain n=1 Tax=Rarobacter incanus TaxID=153494 RepID=A0A542SMV9_9MICO|nr:DegV family protein [Rarobacter incanus]TQK75959.1 DegV family protein with EDD domain [Rarobacter incanus]
MLPSYDGSVPRVGVVTDSTAAGPLAASPNLRVVPLTIIAGGDEFPDSGSAVSARVLAALGEGLPVSTSQPSAQAFAAAYREAAKTCDTVVSVHISGGLSGTVHAAALAASAADVPVTVVDSRTAGAGLAVAATAALRAADLGGSAASVTQAALRAARASVTYFAVGSMEHLRRGGRITRAQAVVGSALGVRPVLILRDGKIEVDHIARSRMGAQRRLVDVVERPLQRQGDWSLIAYHCADPSSVEPLAAALRDRFGLPVSIVDVGGVLGAHVGPGLTGVAVVPGA